MSVRFDASADYLRRTTAGIAASGANLSGCLWCKRKVDTGAFATALYLVVPTSSQLELWLETETGGDRMDFYELPATESAISGGTLTIDTWFFYGFTRSNTSRSLYRGSEAGGTLTKATNGDTRTVTNSVNTLYIGNDVYTEPFNGEIAYVRLWDAVLSDADMDAEWRSATPVRATNLRGDWRLASAATATTDSSGNSLTLTVGGTLADGGANPTPPAAGGVVGSLLQGKLINGGILQGRLIR